MFTILNPNEVRVLACLIEKEKTTPENYPLSLNALVNACNQKSNRNPVVTFSHESVVRALDGLKDKKLVWEHNSPGSRVPKYKHEFNAIYATSLAESYILMTLMLCGPQTVGEIKGHCERYLTIQSIDEISSLLSSMLARAEDHCLIIKLPRLAGQKENRYTHLLSGPPEITEEAPSVRMEPATLAVRTENERLAKLEETVAQLEDKLAELNDRFNTFVSQFQ